MTWLIFVMSLASKDVKFCLLFNLIQLSSIHVYILAFKHGLYIFGRNLCYCLCHMHFRNILYSL